MSIIGIDFDNTLVDYSAAFHQLACEKSLIPVDLPVKKLSVRDYLRKAGQEDAWTEIQGIVYGARMHEAILFDGADFFISEMLKKGHQLFVISHKTKHPFRGEQYDLHRAARAWARDHVSLSQENMYFELTKKDKINRIVNCQCDVFIDDLPEILLHPHFPDTIQKILYDSECHHASEKNNGLTVCQTWREVMSCLSI